MALVTAPQSGEETRLQIRSRGIELRDRAIETAEETRRKAEEAAAQARTRAEQLAKEARTKADEIQQLLHAAVHAPARERFVRHERLGHDGADPHARVQRGVRVLEDRLHGAPVAADAVGVEAGQRPAVELDGPLGRGVEREQQAHERRLARARLADDADGRPGTHVEVRNRLDGRWARGFEIIKHEDGGYRLRRLSDDVELPLVFHEDDVRREKKRGTWWY